MRVVPMSSCCFLSDEARWSKPCELNDWASASIGPPTSSTLLKVSIPPLPGGIMYSNSTLQPPTPAFIRPCRETTCAPFTPATQPHPPLWSKGSQQGQRQMRRQDKILAGMQYHTTAQSGEKGRECSRQWREEAGQHCESFHQSHNCYDMNWVIQTPCLEHDSMQGWQKHDWKGQQADWLTVGIIRQLDHAFMNVI